MQSILRDQLVHCYIYIKPIIHEISSYANPIIGRYQCFSEKEIVDINLTAFTFTGNESAFLLTVCAEAQDFSSASELQLVYSLLMSLEVDIRGTLNADNASCADFDVTRDYASLVGGRHEFDLYAYDIDFYGLHGAALLHIPSGNEICSYNDQ